MKVIALRKTNAAKRAFTLIEIMVATVVMVILVGLVVQMTSEVLKIWNRSSGKLSANAEARITMELLTQDLETAVFRNNGLQWLRVEGPIKLDDNYSEQTVSLKLFSPALDRPTQDENGVIPGDICGVGYRLAYKKAYDDENAPKVYALYRQIVDARTTFDELMGTGVQDALNSGQWLDINIMDERNYLASNIVEFKIFLHADDDNEYPLNDINRDGDVDEGLVVVGGSKARNEDAVFATNLIYADIVLTVMSDEGLAIMQALAEGQGGTGFVDDGEKSAQDLVLEQHGEVFTRRVHFPSQAL